MCSVQEQNSFSQKFNADKRCDLTSFREEENELDSSHIIWAIKQDCSKAHRYAFKISCPVKEVITLGFLAEISFTPLLYHPGGCLGCSEKGTRSRNYNLFVRSAVFQPKWNDVQKTYKNHQNPVKSYCFLGYFQSLFNFGWKTAAQTN